MSLKRSIFWILVLFSVWLCSCATELSGTPAPLDAMEYGVGLAVHPNGRYAYVVNSNFDLEYRATDGGGIIVIDLESGKVLSNASKRIGSFGTQVVLNEDATRGYVVTRSDDHLSWFEISEDGSNIFCPQDPDGDSLEKCRVSVPDDPADIEVIRSYREDQGGIKTAFDLLVIPHMIDSMVTALTLRETTGEPVISQKTAALVYGASEVLWHSGESFFVTGRSATDMTLVQPALTSTGEVVGLGVNTRIATPSAYSSYKGRGMVLDPAKRNLYVLNQKPNSIMAFDVAGLLNNSEDAGSMSVMRSMVLLPRNPSKITWVGEQDHGSLYVTSFQEDTILILAPESMDVIKQIDVGDGPYSLVYDASRNRVLVGHFRSNDIWIFDTTEPTNPKLMSKILGSSKE